MRDGRERAPGHRRPRRRGDGGRPPETDAGALAITAYDGAAARLAEADAALVGCGLGKEPETQRLVRALLRRASIPTVLDADGLGAFAGHTAALAEAAARAPLVLTPHLGELRHLAGEPDLDAADRLATAARFAAAWGVVLVLKGMPSVVALPDGRALVGPPGEVALATAGTGDVLAGLTAGLLAQGLAPADAAACALHLGSAAAARWSATRAAASLRASDLLAELPAARLERFGR